MAAEQTVVKENLDANQIFDAIAANDITRTVTMIRNFGIDVLSCTDVNGRDPIQAAIFVGNHFFAKFLIGYQKGVAALKLNETLSEEEINRRNIMAYNGSPKLHKLIAPKVSFLFKSKVTIDFDEIFHLLDLGISLDRLDKNQKTPLHLAVDENHVEVAALLIGYTLGRKESVDYISPKKDFTPLYSAVSPYGSTKVAKLLIASGAHLTHQAKDGWTPLHHATQWGHPEKVRLLIQQGANGNARDEQGRTPTHYAYTARDDFAGTLRALFKGGAYSALEDNDGLTPFALFEKDYGNKHAAHTQRFVEFMVISPPETPLNLAPSVKFAIEQLSLFIQEDNDISSIINHLKYGDINKTYCNLNEKTNEMIDFLRKNLLGIISCEGNNQFVKNGLSLTEAAYTALLAVAEYKPINERDPILLTDIEDSAKVYISTGYQFDIETLILWHNGRSYRGSDLKEQDEKRYLLNPITNQPFSKLDSEYIQREAKKRGIEIQYLRDDIKLPQDNPPIFASPHSFFQPEEAPFNSSLPDSPNRHFQPQ